MINLRNISFPESLAGMFNSEQLTCLGTPTKTTSWLTKGTIQEIGKFVRSGFSKSHFPLELIQNADGEGAETILVECNKKTGGVQYLTTGTVSSFTHNSEIIIWFGRTFKNLAT